jgi:hypothetical protein
VALSDVQKGVCAEYEFQKLVIMGGRGKLEPARPTTDDNQIDAQVSVRDVFNLSVAIQIKSVANLVLPRRTHIDCRFPIAKNQRRSHPLYWYLFAHLDGKLMRFSDPVFLVPSAVVHRKAGHTSVGKTWYYAFIASVAPDSRDMWVKYRVNPLKIGERILQIVKEAQVKGLTNPEPVLGMPDLVWVGAHHGTG